MKRKIAIILSTVMLFGSLPVNVSAADNDGWTEAKLTDAAANGAWENWCTKWESEKNDMENISLTPGRNESELNFAWYSERNGKLPQFRIYSDAEVSSSALSVTMSNESSYSESIADPEGTLTVDMEQIAAVEGYSSNRVTVSGLKPGVTYYYAYEKGDGWTAPEEYIPKDCTDGYSFTFFGDPQIGSSSGNTPNGAASEQGQDAAVRNDSFNWNNTIECAYNLNPDMSFMLSAGDQIQTRDKKATADSSLTYTKNEIEYSGYLSPEKLKSMPVATTIGNHDAFSKNYTYHFNNPNSDELGSTFAGGDYYFSYGNTLFIMINTNNTNIAEHKQLIEKAVNSDSDAKWKVVTLHQDIYGSGEHSNEPEIVELRYGLVPVFEENGIDVVLTGHDHTYSRSYILKGGEMNEAAIITDDEFEDYIDGKTEIDDKYNNYLSSIEDAAAIRSEDTQRVVNPDGILYLTANSASGSKYYDLVEHKQAYIAGRWQEDVPTFSMIDVTDNEFKINTYRTDNMEKIDSEFIIEKRDNNTEGLKITQLSDTHVYAEELGTEGAAFEEYIASDRKMIAQSEKLFDEAISRVSADDSSVVLISGDLTKDGEKINHQRVAEGLAQLEKAGKSVFVVPGNHDVSNKAAYSYNADGTKTAIETVSPSEFAQIYNDFGYGEAISRDESSLSYTAELGDNYRLIAIDSCIYSGDGEPVSSKTAGRIKPETMSWIKAQAIQAQKDGKKPVAMMHHGVIPHTAIQPTMFPEYLVENYNDVKNTLADLGIPVVFTGHFHSQDISADKSENGNVIYDVETGSLVTNPSPIRHITLNDSTMSVSTEKILGVKNLDMSKLGSCTFAEYSDSYLREGMAGLAEAMLGSEAANAPISPLLKVKDFVAECFCLHYKGDENPSAEVLTIAKTLAASDNASQQFLGGAAMGLINDYATESMGQTADNEGEFSISWNGVHESITDTESTTTTEATTETTTEATTEATTESSKKRTSSGGGSSSSKANAKATTTTTEADTETTTQSTQDNNKTVSVKIGVNSVIVDGEEYAVDAAPYIQSFSSSTLVPLRAVAVALSGGKIDSADTSNLVKWNSTDKSVTITLDNGMTAVFKADSNVITVGSETIIMENGAKAEIKDGRMYIPFRALAKAMGREVEWDTETKTALYK